MPPLEPGEQLWPELTEEAQRLKQMAAAEAEAAAAAAAAAAEVSVVPTTLPFLHVYVPQLPGPCLPV